VALGNIANLYIARRDITNAIPFQRRVDERLEGALALNLAIGSERQKLAHFQSFAERTDRTISLHLRFAPHDPTAAALAALVLLQRKGRILDAVSASLTALRQRFDTTDRSLLDRLNATAAQLAKLALNGPGTTEIDAYRRQLRGLEEEKEQLEADMSERSVEFRAQSQEVSLAAVQATIPPHAALIEFAIYRPFDPIAEKNTEAYGPPHYGVCVLRRDDEVRWKDLGEAPEIDAALDRLRRALRDPKRNDVRELARLVDERVMRPVRALIGNADQFLVSPDGVLNLIPFEALVDEEGQYLVERYSFTYLTSGRDLLRLQIPRGSSSAPVVIANPTFGEPSATQGTSTNPPAVTHASLRARRRSVTNAADLSSVYFAPLAGTAEESRAIKRLFPEAKVYTQDQATESALRRVEAPSILHVATHGFFLSRAAAPSSNPTTGATTISANASIENPLLRSGLALAGANVRSPSDDDGIVTALEASGLNLWGTKLVTLSACDTGLGEVKNGEGVYGLRRAFVLAGTETLVMTLWPVSDYVTRELMTAYYAGLKRGEGRGQALRDIQLQTLRRKGREHPFYWASFIQSGEWADLEGRRHSP
jgi:CHAT domain-containing protein